MKTLVLLFALLTTSIASAESPIGPGTVAFVNDMTTGHAVWVTVYNAIGNIGDSGCVQPGEAITFSGYIPGPSYRVRGEVKENLNCGGRTLFDDWGYDHMVAGIKATMSRSDAGNYYYNVDHCAWFGSCVIPDQQ